MDFRESNVLVKRKLSRHLVELSQRLCHHLLWTRQRIAQHLILCQLFLRQQTQCHGRFGQNHKIFNIGTCDLLIVLCLIYYR